MTTHRNLSRTLASLSMFVALATGGATPSTARAETRSQIVMNAGSVDCPACRVLETYDQDGLSFRAVEAEVQDGELVITAQVAVTTTAGKPRVGTVVFSSLFVMDDTSGAESVVYSDDVCTPSLATRQAGDKACTAISGALREIGTNIIMRDGGVCDPIRHMGC
jgi:hypothetical protein